MARAKITKWSVLSVDLSSKLEIFFQNFLRARIGRVSMRSQYSSSGRTDTLQSGKTSKIAVNWKGRG